MFTSRHFKNLISAKPVEQSVESNSFEKFKAIASLPILRPYFRFLFYYLKKKKKFLGKISKPGHGNLVLITSTVQVELWKLECHFDDIRINFLQVLAYYGFSRSLYYDDASRSNRVELILTIKIYHSSFM